MEIHKKTKEFIRKIKREGIGPYSVQEKDISISPINPKRWTKDRAEIEIYCYKLVSPEMILEYDKFIVDELEEFFGRNGIKITPKGGFTYIIEQK